jgi:hypothetical protein
MILDHEKTYSQEELEKLGIIFNPKIYYGRDGYLSKDGEEGYLLEQQKDERFSVVLRWTYCRRKYEHKK